jgi:hypothetical protein
VTAGEPVSAERLAAAARAQTDLPEARVFDARRAWDDRLPDLWGVTVEGESRKSNAFFRVSDERVAVPAGLSHAARVLSELRPLDGQAWGGGLIYVVTAAGGATPGFPDSWHADESPLADGGVRMTVQMPEAWVAYAAAGGVGPAPSGSSGGGGVTPPAEMATATLDLAADFSLQWRYQLGDGEIEGPSGAPADSPPALSDDQLVDALDGARRRARAPRAMPVREPRPLPSRPDTLVVELWALGPVYVPDRGAGPSVDWAAPPPELVPLLSAADRLPPGLLPQDLESSARVDDGELTASVPAPLVEWAAGGARQRSPRVAGVRSAADMAREGRVRVPLDGSSEWTLEVADGAGWRPARGDAP